MVSVKRYDEAETCYQKALMLNPDHAGSNNALGRILYIQDKRIPALMALCRLIVLEPTSDRAKDDVGYLQEIMAGNVEKNASGGFTIHVDASSIDSTNKKENNFSMVELILSMGAAMPLDTLHLNAASKFALSFKAVCNELKESKGKNHGYYWEYYAPYFIEMNEKDMVETFSHIVFASTDDQENKEWLHSHKKEIDDFYDWSKAFAWKQN